MHPRVARPLFLSAMSLVMVLTGILGGGATVWSAMEPYVRTRNWRAFVATVRLHRTSEIEFTLPTPADKVLENDVVVRLRIKDPIGGRPYQGNFMMDVN